MNTFQAALQQNHPLKIIGVINAYVAMMAEKRGVQALYLSGAGVANYSFGLPDLGITSLNDVVEEVRRIRGATSLPLLVDIDTGWGGDLVIERAIRELIRAGASAIHIEDQVAEKRCGHRAGKQVVDYQEMVLRLEAVIKGRGNDKLFIVARTDSFETEGLEGVIRRAQAYEKAGAEMIFADALPTLDDFITLKKNLRIPVLINQTEFGVTPLFSYDQLKISGIEAILYPLSLARGMMGEALRILETIVQKGTIEERLHAMQPRQELYQFLDYEKKENR